MSMTTEDDIKRWMAKRKAALVVEIIQGKTTISEASRAFDIAPLRDLGMGRRSQTGHGERIACQSFAY